MLARSTLLALALVTVSCSKPQTPVQIHEPVAAKPVAVEVPLAATDKTEGVSGQIDPAQFSHVVNEAGSTFVVLSADPNHAQWAKGDPSLVSNDMAVIVRRDVDKTLVPKAMMRLVGREMSVIGATGEVCRGKLAEPVLLSRVIPHFGERERWNGEDDDGDGVMSPALSEERVAQIAWDMAGDGKLLVAELVEANGNCRDARFARAADLPALATTAARRPSASLTAQAMNALKKLPGYDAIEQSYRGSSHATPSTPWIDSQGADVGMFEFATGKSTYVWVSATGGETCSDFYGHMNVLWKVSGTNAKNFEFEVVYQGDADFTPQMLVHLPGDEAASFVGLQSLLRKDAKGYQVEELHVPFLDCPC